MEEVLSLEERKARFKEMLKSTAGRATWSISRHIELESDSEQPSEPIE